MGWCLGELAGVGAEEGAWAYGYAWEATRRNESEQQVAAGSDKEGERMLLAGSVGIKGAVISHKNREVWNWLQSLKMWKLPLQPVGWVSLAGIRRGCDILMMSEKAPVEVEGTGWRGFEQRPKVAEMMVEAGLTGSFIHYQMGFLTFL